MTLPIKLTFCDTAMMLLEIGPFRLLTDPVVDLAGTDYEEGPIHLYKTSPASTTPSQLGRIDAVLLSHDQHEDNLDHAGRALLSTVPRIFPTPLASSRLGPNADGPNAEGLEAWSTTTLSAPDGTQELTGPVTGFLLSSPLLGDANPIYISGDTVPFPGLDQIAERCSPIGLAILHLGRVQIAPTGDLTFSLSAEEAITFAQSLQAPSPTACSGSRRASPQPFKSGSLLGPAPPHQGQQRPRIA